MFSAVELASFALIGFAVHELLSRDLARHQQEQVADRLADLRFMLEHGRSVDLVDRVHDKIAAVTSNGRTRYWVVERGCGVALRRRRRANGADHALATGRAAAEDRLRTDELALLGADIAATPVHPPLRLVAGIDTAPINQILRTFEIWLLPVMLCGAVLVAALSYHVAGVRTEARGAALGGCAAHRPRTTVASGCGCRRCRWNWRNSAGSFNSALDRLDTAYTQLESFNADVAHELRTPLANLIGQTQGGAGA